MGTSRVRTHAHTHAHEARNFAASPDILSRTESHRLFGTCLFVMTHCQDILSGQNVRRHLTFCPLKFWAVFGFGFDGISVRNQRSVLTESAFGISVRF